MNKYDLDHVVTGHSTMSQSDWEQIYRTAWEAYYTPEHIATVMRRAEACGLTYRRVLEGLVYFYHFITREDVHPLEGGFLRMKHRRDRRVLGCTARKPVDFLPTLLVRNYFQESRYPARLQKIWSRRKGNRRRPGPPQLSRQGSLTPVSEKRTTRILELLTHTPAARAAVEHYRKIQNIGA